MADIDIGPGELNITNAYANDANEIDVFFLEEDEVTPIPMDGAVITAHAKERKSDENALIAAQMIAVDAYQGHFLMRWPGDEIYDYLNSINQETWRGFWDMQVLQQGKLAPVTWVAGKIMFAMDVSR